MATTPLHSIQMDDKNTVHNEFCEKHDWSYDMRQDKQMITKGIFLGPYAAASKTKLPNLRDCGITHIVCVRHKLEAKYIRPNFPECFRYLVLDVRDDVYENIMVHFSCVNKFINEGINNGGAVLIHGNAGISRSATFMIAFIMKKYSMTYRDAYNIVRDRRFCINPNLGFTHQLKEYEPICQAESNCFASVDQTSSGVKRSASEIEMEQD